MFHCILANLVLHDISDLGGYQFVDQGTLFFFLLPCIDHNSLFVY